MNTRPAPPPPFAQSALSAQPRPPVELLAPARDAQIGMAAIDHGADAVYIGGPAFGARANAANSVEDIGRLATYAHRFGARVFVAVNTILDDTELEGAHQLACALHAAGADALIVQDMAFLEMELPPIELHASTQTDIRSPEKARFLQDVGFAQIVLARELTLEDVAAVANSVRHATLEAFVHGALCVAYSGQCFISHAHTGRSANRGDCSQACRLPYTLNDAQGRVVAHDRHLLSLKDNDQTANLRALLDAGVRSFKIEGRYKDLAYVKNVTAHYRLALDRLIDADPQLTRASEGRCRFHFTPDPARNFHRGHSDYFARGRVAEIEAFDSPKWSGTPLGHVESVGATSLVVVLDEGVEPLHNGDGLTYFDLQGELVGLALNQVQALGGGRWRVDPNEAPGSLPGLRAGTVLARNRDAAWNRLIEGRTAEREIAIGLAVLRGAHGYELQLASGRGVVVSEPLPANLAPANDPAQARASLARALGQLGDTAYRAETITIDPAFDRFLPVAQAKAWRRAAVARLDEARARSRPLPQRPAPVDPPAVFPQDTLSYLGNVANHKANAFYLRHGVRVVEAAYECHEEPGEVSLMITKHCVRWSLSLCPKQARGVVGVQGTVRAEPMTLVNGSERLTLRFDCKPCEMHVVGRMKPAVLRSAPLKFMPRPSP
jgi:putative protease